MCGKSWPSHKNLHNHTLVSIDRNEMRMDRTMITILSQRIDEKLLDLSTIISRSVTVRFPFVLETLSTYNGRDFTVPYRARENWILSDFLRRFPIVCSSLPSDWWSRFNNELHSVRVLPLTLITAYAKGRKKCNFSEIVWFDFLRFIFYTGHCTMCATSVVHLSITPFNLL